MATARERDSLEQARALYLDLMRRALADRLHDRPELIPVEPRGLLKRAVSRLLGRRGLEVICGGSARVSRTSP
mgnify:CR=1 FL=1